MKTNQIMKRPMGEFVVEQRTIDSMFNATYLLEQWNKTHPNKKRSLDNFWKSTNLVELMSEIAENELDFKSVNFTELKNALSKTARGKNGGTYMQPLLFIKFAMYLNPRFEYHVLKFVSDQMIDYRKENCEAYKALSSAVAKIVPMNQMKEKMPKVAKALNWIVFNSHELQIRNEFGIEAKQREQFELEHQVAMLINDGFIRDYEYLMGYLRRKFCERWRPELLG